MIWNVRNARSDVILGLSFLPFQINECNNRTFSRQLSRIEECANKFVDVTMLRIVHVVI